MRLKSPDVYLVGPLPVDPGVDQILAEDVPLQQECVVGLERGKRRVERAGNLSDLTVRLLEEVVVGRSSRVELALDTVEARHQHRREREVRVRGRVGGAGLDALLRWVLP